MILLNPQIEEGKVYNSVTDQFPKLYWKDFDGNYVRTKDISIELVDGHWEVQTDSTDENWIHKKVTEFLKADKEKNEKRIADAMARINAIKEVM